MVLLVGVDLSWSGRNPTGICAVEVTPGGTSVQRVGCEAFDAAGAAGWLNDSGDDVVAGIDAPLIVTPARRAEAEMARVYGRAGVFAYAARPAFLTAHRIAEGPALGSMLAQAGWNLDPCAIGSSRRSAVEVFPHAICVAMLGAPRALRYKKGALALRLPLLAELQRMLHAYAQAELPAVLDGLGEELLTPIERCSGREMKHIEDKLDAVACMFAAHRAWLHGVQPDEVFGDATHGYIAVPRLR